METAGQAKEILQVLRTIYQRHLACDFVLTISEPDVVEFRVHRAMLAAFCGTFKKLLEAGQLITDRFHLQAVDSHTMGHLIDYIYTGTLEIKPGNVFAILSAASQLEMSQVTTMCQNFLMTGMSTDQLLNVNIAVPVVKESGAKGEETSSEVLLSEAASLPSTSASDLLSTPGEAKAKVAEAITSADLGSVIDNSGDGAEGFRGRPTRKTAMGKPIIITPEETTKKASKRGRKRKASKNKEKKGRSRKKEVNGDSELDYAPDFDWSELDIEVASDADSDTEWTNPRTKRSSKNRSLPKEALKVKLPRIQNADASSSKGAQKRKRGRPRRCQSSSSKKPPAKHSKKQRNQNPSTSAVVVEYGRKRGRPRKGESAIVRLSANRMMYSDLKCPVCQELFVHFSARCLHQRIHSRLRFRWVGRLQKKFMPLFVRKCFVRHSVPSVDGICQSLIAVKQEILGDVAAVNGVRILTGTDETVTVQLPDRPESRERSDENQPLTDVLVTTERDTGKPIGEGPVEIAGNDTETRDQNDLEKGENAAQNVSQMLTPGTSAGNEQENVARKSIAENPESSDSKLEGGSTEVFSQGTGNLPDSPLVSSAEKVGDSPGSDLDEGIEMSISDFDVTNIRTIIEEEQSKASESQCTNSQIDSCLDSVDIDVQPTDNARNELTNVARDGPDSSLPPTAVNLDSGVFQRPSQGSDDSVLAVPSKEESSCTPELSAVQQNMAVNEVISEVENRSSDREEISAPNKPQTRLTKQHSFRPNGSHIRYEYECKLCHVKFPYHSQCIRHRIHKHGYLRHCGKCRNKFDHPSSMSCHKVTSHNAGLCVKTANTLTCAQCGCQFLHKKTMEQHKLRIHSNTEDSTGLSQRNLQCRHCQRSFKYAKALRIHLPYHGLTENEVNLEFTDPDKVQLRSKTFVNRDQDASNRLKRKCPVCGKVLSNEHHLRMHMSYVHGLPVTKAYVMKMKNMTVKKWPCTELNCDFAGLMLHELKTHMASSHPDVLYQCRACRFKTSVRKRMDRHTKQIHTSGKTCEMCSRQFRKFYHLKAHRFKAHNIIDPSLKLHKCSVQGCDYIALQRYVLDIHMNKHRPEKPFQCHECGKKLKTEKNLGKHINKVHKRIRPYICDQCGASYGEESELKTHMARHEDLKKFHCNLCDYTTQEKGNYQSHMWAQHKMRIHDKQRVFQCSTCDYSTDRKTRFSQHMASHNDIRAHKCPHCEKTFVAKTTMSSHIKWAHMEKMLRCDYCDHKTSTLNMLREHVRMMHTHRDVKPYKCAYCDYRCRTSGNCRKHCMNRHKDQEVKWVRVCEKYPNNSKPMLSFEAGMTENGIARKDARTERIFPYEQKETSSPVIIIKSTARKSPAVVINEQEQTPLILNRIPAKQAPALVVSAELMQEFMPAAVPQKLHCAQGQGNAAAMQIEQQPMQIPLQQLQVQQSQTQMLPLPQNQAILVQSEPQQGLHQLLGSQVHTLTQLSTEGVSVEQPLQMIQQVHSLPPPPTLTPAPSHQLPMVTGPVTPVMLSGPAQLTQAQQYLVQYIQQQQQHT